MRRLSWCLLAALFFLPTDIQVSAADKPLGRVVPKSDLVVLRVGRQIVGDVHSIAWPATAKTVDGRWLWLQDDGGSGGAFTGGWVRSDDVVTVGKGLELFNSRLIADPNSSSAYWLRGLCWEQAHEFGIAAKDYQEVVARDPFNRSAWLGLARSLAAHGQFDNNRFQAAQWANPSSPRVLVEWGHALVNADQRDLARSKFEEARRLNPNWYLPYYSLGKLAAEQKEYHQALEHYAEALRRDPSYHVVHRDRALAWLASKQITFEEMAKILSDPHPNPETAMRWLAEHHADEIAASALTAAHKACELSGFRDAESLSVLAQAFAALGRWPEARRFEQMAVEYAPFHIKPTHTKRYYVYDKLLSPDVMLADNDQSRSGINEARTTQAAKSSGDRATQNVARPSQNARPGGGLEESTVREAPVETLPQPAASAPRYKRFIDRSSMRFQ